MNTFFSALNYALLAIVALEQTFPQGGLGNTKKQIVLNGISAGAQAGATVGTALNQPQITAISTFIDGTVKLLNDSGAFKTAKAS